MQYVEEQLKDLNIPLQGIPMASLFSGGIDGMAQGFMMASELYKPYVAIDIDKRNTRVLKDNYDHTIITADIRDMVAKVFDGCKVLSITAPCREYSNAKHIHSSRKDFKKKIEGKELYLHGFRILALTQPEVYIAENVPKMLNYKVPAECFTELRPYDTYIYIVDTKDFNLPQNRSRAFFVGFKRPWPFKEAPKIFQHQIHSRQLSIGDIREQSPNVKIPEYIKTRLNEGYRDKPSYKFDHEIANTCCRHYSKDQGTQLIQDEENGYKGWRPYTNREFARLQGISDSYKLNEAARTVQYGMVGDSVCPVISRAFGLEVLKYFKYYYRISW